MTKSVCRVLVLTLSAVFLAACAVAEPPRSQRTPIPETERPAARLLETADDPRPIELPADAAPHDRLTEWWYYTGHLEDDAGNLYGFQFVIFQVIRGEFPPTYAAHFAVTDVSNDEFRFAERVDGTPPRPGEMPFEFHIHSDEGEPWSLSGGAGLDRITADLDGYAIDVELESQKSPVLHEGDGFFQFAPGAESYYYSRTRMSASGTLFVDGNQVPVTGNAWMDHQWGDFLVLDDVGWDWFSVQLDSGDELMAWQSHDRQGNALDANATIIQVDGTPIDVPGDLLQISVLDEWTSPVSGATYPMGWRVEIPEHEVNLTVEPVFPDQELITLESTGVIYWEGLVTVQGEIGNAEVTGLGYVELTGYADATMVAP